MRWDRIHWFLCCASMLATPGCGAGIDSISTTQGTVALAPGYQCVLVEPGDVRCWGENESGVLGNDTTEASAEPTAVLELSADVGLIAAGPRLACGVTADGAVQCWGTFTSWSVKVPRYCTPSNPCSGDGYNHYSTQALHAQDLPEIQQQVRSLAIAAAHLCVLGAEGEVACYTLDTWSEDKPSRVAAQQEFSWAAPAKSLAAGKNKICALLEDSSVRCVDADLGETVALESGELGDLRQVALLSDMVCVLTDPGVVRCDGAPPEFQSLEYEPDPEEPTEAWHELRGVRGAVGRMITGADHICVLVAGEGLQCTGSQEMVRGVDDRSEFFPWVVSPMPANPESIDPFDQQALMRYKPGRLKSSVVVDGSAGQSLTCVTTGDSVVCWGLDVFPGEVVASSGNMTKTQLHPSFPVEIEGLD